MDPKQTPFFKAMQLCEGVLVILDKEATPFQRIWCCFEQATVAQGKKLLLDIATVQDGEPELLTDGVAYDIHRCPEPNEGPLHPSYAEYIKGMREKHFPLELATRSFGTELQKAEASMPADRTRILNTIAGRTGAELQLPAEAAHPSYDRLNAVLRGRFAASALAQLIEEGEPLGPCVAALKLSEMPKLPLTLKFPEETAEALGRQVFGSLPAELEELDLRSSTLRRGGLMALAAALPTTNIRVLRCARPIHTHLSAPHEHF